MVGETLGWFIDHEATSAFAWMGSGALPLFGGIGAAERGPRFSSQHTSAGVGFCFGDGHVKYLPPTIDVDVLIALAGIDEGQVVNSSEF